MHTRLLQISLIVVLVFAVVSVREIPAQDTAVTVVHETQGRNGPGSFYTTVIVVPKDMSVTVLETRGSWLKIVLDENEVWISRNAVSESGRETDTSAGFSSPFLDREVSAAPTRAALTAAVKGFWTRYAPSAGEDASRELPVEGHDIPVDAYLSFSAERSREVDRESLWNRYPLRDPKEPHGVTVEDEQSIGYACAVSAASGGALIESGDTLTYLYSVGWYLAESTERYDIRYSFHVVDTDRVNAVSCPGGYIVLTRGLLELIDDEAELAALLAHEMAHIIAGHGMYELMENEVQITAESAFDVLASETGGTSDVERDLLAVASRAVAIARQPKLDEYEHEADRMAMQYLARSGYDVGGLRRLLTTLASRHRDNADMFDLNYRNHPDFDARLDRVERERERYRSAEGGTFAGTYASRMSF